MGDEKKFSERLKKELSDRGLISEQKFKQCLAEASKKQESLVEILYQSSGLAEKDVTAVVSQIFGYPPINVSTFIIEDQVLGLVPKEFAKKYHLLPVTLLENALTVAIADPTDLRAIDDLRAKLGLRIKPAVAIPGQLDAAIQKYYGNGAK